MELLCCSLLKACEAKAVEIILLSFRIALPRHGGGPRPHNYACTPRWETNSAASELSGATILINFLHVRQGMSFR